MTFNADKLNEISKPRSRDAIARAKERRNKRMAKKQKETKLLVTVEPDMVDKVKYALGRVRGVVKVEE